MEQILKTLQEIQIEAMQKGIASFHLTAIRDDGGKYIISVGVRLRDVDTDGDYLSESFYPDTFGPEFIIARIKAFINTL